MFSRIVGLRTNDINFRESFWFQKRSGGCQTCRTHFYGPENANLSLIQTPVVTIADNCKFISQCMPKSISSSVFCVVCLRHIGHLAT